MQDGFLPSEPCPFDKVRRLFRTLMNVFFDVSLSLSLSLYRGERERERDRSIAEMKGSLLPAGLNSIRV